MFDYKESIDRRQHMRAYQDIPGQYLFFDCEKSVVLAEKQPCLIRNISPAGLLMETDMLSEEWKEGLFSGMIKIVLEIKLPGMNTPIRCLGKVIWFNKVCRGEEKQQKYELGMNFIDITTQAQDAITDFVLRTYLEKS